MQKYCLEEYTEDRFAPPRKPTACRSVVRKSTQKIGSHLHENTPHAEVLFGRIYRRLVRTSTKTPHAEVLFGRIYRRLVSTSTKTNSMQKCCSKKYTEDWFVPPRKHTACRIIVRKNIQKIGSYLHENTQHAEVLFEKNIQKIGSYLHKNIPHAEV
jgi:pyrimidine deaminase RibD-like protein